MRAVTVRYGSRKILDGLSWTVRRGENWVIFGPNGAGKTTVLKLILGDQLQGYANDITLFGRKKGSGEKLRDIKRRIGVVSVELQNTYRKRLTGLDVVLSGFFDSIGLYRKCTEAQEQIAAKWISRFGIEDLAGRNFNRLSYGQRQLVLLARAMVKMPDLLLLDEPCDGLDAANRSRLLEILEKIGQRPGIQLIYVTHRMEDIVPSMTHVLRLDPVLPAFAAPIPSDDLLFSGLSIPPENVTPLDSRRCRS